MTLSEPDENGKDSAESHFVLDGIELGLFLCTFGFEERLAQPCLDSQKNITIVFLIKVVYRRILNKIHAGFSSRTRPNDKEQRLGILCPRLGAE